MDLSTAAGPGSARVGVEHSARAVLDRGARPALITFVAIEIAAAVTILWLARDQWFYWDEWDLLAGREPASFSDFVRPWHQHWVGGAGLVYQAVFAVFGLHSYLPYQLLSVGAHLALAAMLRLVMRRAGVGPWIATALAGAFAVYGTGDQDFVWGYQITFTAPLLLGLVHMVLADHEGSRSDWRDGVGIALGLAALTFSSTGLVMAGVVGLTAVVRRGWKVAVVHSAPAVGCYLLWWAVRGRDAVDSGQSSVSLVARFVGGASEAALHGLGQLPGSSIVLLGAMLVGLSLAWHRIGRADVRARAVEPAALALGGLVLLVLIGRNRVWVGELLTGSIQYASRYLHVAMAMLLPALGVAINEVYRRWQPLGWLVLAVVLVGVPGNVREIGRREGIERQELGDPDLFLAVANSPLLDEAPSDLRPFTEREMGVVTVDWIRRARGDGRIPRSEERDGVTQAAEIRLSIEQGDEAVVAQTCEALTAPTPRSFEPGDRLGLVGRVVIRNRAPGSNVGSAVTYDALNGGTLSVLRPLRVTLVPSGPTEICG